MAEQEGGAFVCSNVTNRPRGFLSYVTVVNSAWVPGKLGIIATGAFLLHACEWKPGLGVLPGRLGI